MNYLEGDVCHVPESGCVGLFPAGPSVACRSGPGSWQSGFFCAPVLTAGSRSARRFVICSWMERSWVLRSGCCWPSRVLAGPEGEALPRSPADRRDARLRRIGSSAGLRPPPAAVLGHRSDMSSGFVRRRAPAAPPRWPMLPLVARAACGCGGGAGLHDGLRPGVVHGPTHPAGQVTVRPGSPWPSGRAGSPGP